MLSFGIEQMLLGTSRVRDVLGGSFSATDKEIQESLWHYYYDVDKTVNYLLSMTYHIRFFVYN